MKKISNQNGFTIIELIVVIPLIVIIVLISYNMFFLATKSFKDVNQNFSNSEELRMFIIDIQKEANQAKKAQEDIDALHRVNQSEIYIYTDIDEDNIPELVRYRLEDDDLIKDIKKASNDEYPYEFDSSFANEKVVLKNVINTEIFKEVERVKVEIEGYDDKDYRRKLKMRIETSVGKDSNPSVVEIYLVTKSRTKYE